MALITILTPCFNEQGNIPLVYARVKEIFEEELPQYCYEHLFIDNASTDGTLAELREIAGKDPRVKVIVNVRNFGHIRSPYYGLLQTNGDAVIGIVADLQDPPGLIPELIRKWEEGYKVVVAVKSRSDESLFMRSFRRVGYRVLNKISSLDLISDFGFGLFDRAFVDVLRSIDDPYPYFRGMISEIGFPVARVEYRKPQRQHGRTKNNFLTLFDVAMLGLVKHSRMPMRLATLAGFGMSAISLMIAMGYLVAKLMFWDRFEFGQAPMLVGVYFFASVQIFFVGVLGEYVGAIHTQVRKLPLVVERERINFD
jgi:polyisoprenyl-phosphate glycosyltransferase